KNLVDFGGPENGDRGFEDLRLATIQWSSATHVARRGCLVLDATPPDRVPSPPWQWHLRKQNRPWGGRRWRCRHEQAAFPRRRALPARDSFHRGSRAEPRRGSGAPGRLPPPSPPRG